MKVLVSSPDLFALYFINELMILSDREADKRETGELVLLERFIILISLRAYATYFATIRI